MFYKGGKGGFQGVSRGFQGAFLGRGLGVILATGRTKVTATAL